MPQYVFVDREGKQATVNVPENASPEYALRYLTQKYGPDKGFQYQPSPPGIGQQLLSLPENITKSFIRGITVDPASGLASLGYAGARAVDEDLKPFEETAVGRSLASAQEALAPTDTGIISQFGSGLGSFASFIPGALLKVPLKAATLGAQSIGVGSEEARARAEQSRLEGVEVSPGQQLGAQLGGGAVGITEILPAQKLVSTVTDIFRATKASDLEKNAPGLLKSLRRIAETGGLEAAQEAAAGIAQDLIQKGVYDPSVQVGDSALNDAALGGSVGAFAQGMVELVTRGKRKERYEFLKAEEEKKNVLQQEIDRIKEEEKQMRETSRKLGVPETPMLALPAPAQEVTVPEETKDPLVNPLGMMNKNELTSNDIKQINLWRQSRGQVPLRSFSIEDLVDAGLSPEERISPDKIDSIIANKTGYQGEAITPQDVLNMASQANVDTTTEGFGDFLRRTTGSSDLGSMSPPRLFAAFQALRALPPSETRRVLPPGTNATRFSRQQYAKGLKILSGWFDSNNRLDRRTAIKRIQEATGLTSAIDADSIIQTAIRRGALALTGRPSWEVVDAEGKKRRSYLKRESAERAAKKEGLNVRESTRFDLTLPGQQAAIPEALDIRQGDFAAGTAPEAYEIASEDGVISEARTVEEAESLADRLAKIREKKAAELVKQIANINENAEKRLAKLEEQIAEGKSNTVEFAQEQAAAAVAAKEDQAKIEALQDRIRSFAQPLEISPRGEKPVTTKGFTLFDNGQPIGTFPTRIAAEQAAILRMDQKAIENLIRENESKKGLVPARIVSEAKKELERRKSGKPGIEVVADLTPEQRAEEKAREEKLNNLSKELQKVLDKIGLKEVRIRLLESIKAYNRSGELLGEADGQYSRRLIEFTIAMSGDNPLRALNHEVIHALKQLGAFTDRQWQVLENRARSEWMKKYDIARRYGRSQLSAEKMLEEAIADAFSDFATGTKPPAGLIQTLFRKVKTFFEALGNALEGQGFTTAESVFGRIQAGEMAIAPGRVGEVRENERLRRAAVERLARREAEQVAAQQAGQPPVATEGAETDYSLRSRAPGPLPDTRPPLPDRRKADTKAVKRGLVRGIPDNAFLANLPKVVFEIAPDPDNAELAARWAELSDYQKGAVSQRVIEQVLPLILEEFDAKGYLTPQIGSYIDKTNPSFAAHISAGNITELVNRIGFVFGQREMVGLSINPEPGMSQTPAVVLQTGDMDLQRVQRMYDRLREIEVNGEKVIGGQSFVNGNMIILNYTSIPNDQYMQLVANKINQAYPDENFSIAEADFYTTYPGKSDYDYSERKDDPPGVEGTLRERSRALRNAASRALEEELRFLEEGRPQVGIDSIDILNRAISPPSLGKKVSITDVGNHFDGLIVNPEDRDWRNPEVFARAVEKARREIAFQLEQDDSGLNWYIEDVGEAFEITRALIPALHDPVNQQVFSVIAGILSAQSNPKENWDNAAKAFEVFVETGVIPERNPISGANWGLEKGNQIALFNALINKFTQEDPAKSLANGKAKAIDWLLSPQAVSEINAYRREYGGKTTNIPGKRTDQKLGLFALGEKIGSFISNLNGIQDETVDRWMVRTFNRYFGNMIETNPGLKEFGKLRDSPLNEAQRTAIKRLLQEAVAPLNVSSMQGQSLLWFFEQRLFTEMGANSPSYGYSDGARKYRNDILARRERQGAQDGSGQDIDPDTQNSLRLEQIGGRSGIEGSGLVLSGQRQPDAITVAGVHYGNQPNLNSLDSTLYGTGLKGAEARRLVNSDDERIKRRAYFYIPQEDGAMPGPETGLGDNVYIQKFSNILGPGEAMKRIVASVPPGFNFANDFESAIVDAGYDGYAVPNMGMMVILNHNVPVDYRGTRLEVASKPPEKKVYVGDQQYSIRKTDSKAGTKAKTNEDNQYAIALTKVFNKDPNTLLVPRQNGPADGVLGVLPADYPNWRGLPITLPVGYHNEDQKKPGRGAAHILYRARQDPSREPMGSEEIVEKIARAALSIASGYDAIYNARRKDAGDDYDSAIAIMRGQNALILGRKNNRAEIVTMYNVKDPVGKWQAPRWQGKAPNKPFTFNTPPVGVPVKASGFQIQTDADIIAKPSRVLRTDEMISAAQLLGKVPSEQSAADKKPRATLRLAGRDEPDTQMSLRQTTRPDIVASVDRTTSIREEKGFAARMAEAFSPKSMESFRQAFINKYEAIERLSKRIAKRFGEKELLAENSAIAAALMSDRAAGIAASSFLNGIPVYKNGFTQVSDMNGQVKGLIKLLEPLAAYKDPYIYRLFQFYASTRRAKRLLAEGREKLFQGSPGVSNTSDIQKGDELERTHPVFKQVWADYQKYNEGLVRFMRDTGVISDANAQIWMMDSDYIPFYRQLDGEQTTGPKIFSELAAIKQPKALKGSDAKLNDFMENMVRNARAAIEAGMKNVAAQRVVRDMVRDGIGRIAPPKASGHNIVSVLQNGATVRYEVDDMLLVEALKGLNMPELPFLHIFAAPARFLRSMVTKDPGFMLANLIRDSATAWVTSGVNITPIVDTFKQYGQALANTSPEVKRLSELGLFTGYDFAGDIRASTEFVEQELKDRTKSWSTGEKAILPLRKIWELLDKGSTASDVATRAEVFKRVLAETGSEAEAAYQALEVINFSRKGNSALIRILTAVTPFLNARIQGLDVLYRAGTGKFATERAERQKKAFMVRSMTILALSSMYWMLASDEEEYKNAEPEARDNNWIIGNVRIPIPFEIGVLFKVFPERILEYFFGNDTGKDLKDSIVRNITSTLAVSPPQAALPIVENIANYSFFTGQPIVGRGVEDLEKPYQVTSGTSLLAQKIGEATNQSPVMLDNLIRGYTGTMGMYAVMLIDAIMRGENDPTLPSMTIEQMPVVKRFFASPNATGSIGVYYDMKRSVDTATRTINMLERTGNGEELRAYLQGEGGKLLQAKPYIEALQKNMVELRNARRMILISQMEPTLKRERLDAIRKAEIAMTKRIQEFKKNADL